MLGLGLRGYDEGDAEDPFWIAAEEPLDRPLVAGPLDQVRREDMQVFGFLESIAKSGGQHPLSVRMGSDPPDRFVSSSQGEWRTELTELTVSDVRADLARVRRFGRRFQERLQRQLHKLPHLRGRHVSLFHAPEAGVAMPRDVNALTTELEAALQENRGCVAESVDASEGLPDKLPLSGIYGKVGPLVVMVRDGNRNSNGITVSASAQATVRRSEARRWLSERIAAKDVVENQILLITCGLPDQAGYVCPLDGFIFWSVKEARASADLVPREPRHLQAVALHDFASGEWLEIYRAQGASAPWMA